MDPRKERARQRKIDALRERATAPSEAVGRTMRRVALAALAVGIALRLVVLLVAQPAPDGAEYYAMGQAWARHGEFLLPFGDVTDLSPEPAYSHHYPPAYPFYLGVVFSLLGEGLWQMKLAALLVSLAALAVVRFTTRDLYGDLPALLVTGLVALEPTLLSAQAAGYSENLVVAFFALTMWAIMRSLKDDRFILLAGLFAGLAYLTRASIGPFFLVAGLGGFAWRFCYRRWGVFRNPWYMGAIALFATIFLAWAARNVARFGWPRWETSSYLTSLTGYAFQHPGTLAVGLAAKLPLFLLFLAYFAWPFVGEARASLRRIRDEDVSALWLSLALLWVLGWIVTSVFWVLEQRPLWWIDNLRYVVIGFVPLAWIFLGQARPSQATLNKCAALGAVFLLASVGVVLESGSPAAATGRWLAQHLREGDGVGVTGGKYDLVPFLPDAPEARFFVVHHPPENRSAEWVVSPTAVFPGAANYTLAASFRQTSLLGADTISRVFVRNDVAQARGVPANETTILGPWGA